MTVPPTRKATFPVAHRAAGTWRVGTRFVLGIPGNETCYTILTLNKAKVDGVLLLLVENAGTEYPWRDDPDAIHMTVVEDELFADEFVEATY